LPARGTASRADTAPNHGDQGQSLVELAIVTPVLVLLIMAIFQFAFVLETQIGLTNAAREAARRAAATTSDNPTWPDLQSWTLLQLRGDGTPANPGLLPENVQAYDAGHLWAAPYPGMTNTTSPAVSFCSYSVAGITNYRAQVEVKYKHPVFFGPISFATDLVDGSPNGFWDLFASAQIRMENVDRDVVNGAGNDPGPCT
jgi:hypothetical protein